MKIAQLTALGIAVSAYTLPLVAQSNSCATSDSMVIARRGYARDIAGTTDDPEYVRLPTGVGRVVTDSNTVAITADATICRFIVLGVITALHSGK